MINLCGFQLGIRASFPLLDLVLALVARLIIIKLFLDIGIEFAFGFFGILPAHSLPMASVRVVKTGGEGAI